VHKISCEKECTDLRFVDVNFDDGHIRIASLKLLSTINTPLTTAHVQLTYTVFSLF